MNEIRQKILEEARSWIGTPFHHRAALKGVGVDCVQFVVAVYRSADPHFRCAIPRYGRKVRSKGTIFDEVQRWFVAVDTVNPGDLGVFRISDTVERDQHLAIFTTHGLIHCDSDYGVREHSYAGEWPDRFLASYAIPSLAPGGVPCQR